MTVSSPFATTRRSVLAGAVGLGLSASLPKAFARTRASLIVIGGGFGGATAARTLKRLMPEARVTLIEANNTYLACPFSNLVIGGTREMRQQAFAYDALGAEGIDVIEDMATGVDAEARIVSLSRGSPLSYDRLVLSPGIEMRWNAIEGYDASATEKMPHAWKAGPQTTRLRDQVAAMPDNGLVILSAPAAPYRCPPGPYERASLIAHYLKTTKPRAKLIVLDSKDTFSKQPLFEQAWQAHYSDVLDWRGAAQDGRVSRVDAGAMTIETDFETFQPDVANIIPPQRAGEIARRAGVADDTGWCPVDAVTFESTLQPNIHVIGDAIVAAPMPKSAFSANLQGKVCAIQIARLMAGLEAEPTVLANTCYSYVTPDSAVSIVGVYDNQGGTFSSIDGAGGLSPMDDPLEARQAEARQAKDWFNTVTREAFG